MKVLIISGPDPYRWKGGIESYLINLELMLKEAGLLVDLEHFEKHNLKISELDDYYKFATVVQNKLHNYDVVICNSIYGAFIETQHPKFFTICHGLYTKPADMLPNNLKKSIYLDLKYKNGLMEMYSYNSRNVVATSSYILKHIRKFFSPKRLLLIRNCIDTSIFKPMNLKKDSIHKGKLVGLYVGRTDTTKGYDIFTKLYNLTKGYVHWIQCISTGGLNDCKVIEDIETYIEVPNKEMPYVYGMADFVFFPSRYEGFGLVSVESLACGKPVIAFQTGIFKSISKLLPILNLGDPSQDLDTVLLKSMHVINLMKDYRIRRMIGNYGRNIAIRYFNMDAWRAKWLKLLGITI